MKKFLALSLAVSVALPVQAFSQVFESASSEGGAVKAFAPAPISVPTALSGVAAPLAPIPGVLSAPSAPVVSGPRGLGAVAAAEPVAAPAEASPVSEVLESPESFSASSRIGADVPAFGARVLARTGLAGAAPNGAAAGISAATLDGFFDGGAARRTLTAFAADASDFYPSRPMLHSRPSERAEPHRGVPTFREVHVPWSHAFAHFYENFSEAMRETALPVVMLATVGLAIAGGISYHHESVRAQTYPLAFSEISQIEKDAQYAHRGPVGPMTRYLAGTNDLVMKILESYDAAHTKGSIMNADKTFANELDYRIEYKFHRYEIQNYLDKASKDNLATLAENARAELAPFVRAKAEIDSADEHLDKAWSASHVDHYHTRHYTVTVSNSSGKGTHTEPRSEEIYDNTTHSYDYDRREGAAAAAQLNAAIATDDVLAFNETIPTASQTNAEGEYAAELSRRQAGELKGQLDVEAYKKISAIWKYGSTLWNNLPFIGSQWKILHGDAPEWSQAAGRARSESYVTASQSDSGPQEYQDAEKVLDDGRKFSASVGEILDGMDYTQKNTQVLSDKVHQLIAVELDHAKGNPRKLSADIIEISRGMYAANFKNGLDFQRFRADMLVLFSLLGALIGGGLGVGYRALIDRFGWFKAGS
jgi:hypothetical protein